MNAIPSKERIESFVSEITGTLSSSLRDYLEAHCRPRVVRQFTTVKPITTYNEENEEAKIGDWVWVEKLNRVCLVTGHSSQPGQPIFVQYCDTVLDPFEVVLLKTHAWPGGYVTVVRRRTETVEDAVSEGEESVHTLGKTEERAETTASGTCNAAKIQYLIDYCSGAAVEAYKDALTTAELVAMLKERPDVTVLNHPLREAQVKIAYFDPVRNERRMYATYGPCTIMVVQEGTA